MEEPGRLQFMGLRKVKDDLATKQQPQPEGTGGRGGRVKCVEEFSCMVMDGN